MINNAFYAVVEKLSCQAELPEKSEQVVEAGLDYKPTFSVSTKKVVDKVLISISDKGNSIPKNIVDKIFQPFFTTKSTGNGTGLGLSLSYYIVKANAGEIKV